MNHSVFHVLLADDDPDDRHFFEEALKKVNADIVLTVAEDGDQLMEQLKEATARIPDLVFLDLNMPRKNGLECLIEIKQVPSLRTLPVIILSTGNRSSEMDKLYLLGAHFYVKKPSDLNHLGRLIDYILRHPAEEWRFQPEKKDFILNLKVK